MKAPAGIRNLEWTDVLDSSMTFEEGSATIGDSSVNPRVEGNLLHWTFEGIGRITARICSIV